MALEARDRERIAPAIDVLIDGRGDVRKLQGGGNLYRLRVGDFRVIFERDLEAGRLIVLRVGNRRDAYRQR